MSRYLLDHLASSTVRHDLRAACSRGRYVTADILAHIAEFDIRKLYLEDGYPSMHAYCMGELRFSEASAYKRIQAARVARRFPVLFETVADGRLHLSAVCMLAPHLTHANLDDLVAAATHQSKAKIELMLAQRFPRPDVPTHVRAIPAPVHVQLAPGQVGGVPPSDPAPQHAPEHVAAPAPAAAQPPLAAPRPRITPLAPQRYALTVTIDESTQLKLREAQELLGHAIPSGDVAQVLDRALDLLVTQLRKRKCGEASKPRAARDSGDRRADPRAIPAHVKRIVWARDGAQCTFKSRTGHRCEARKLLEFDHVVEVARGGEASVSNIRLRCRAHNQFTAAQVLGAELMSERRRAAIEAREKARLRAAAETAAVREAAARVLGAPSPTSESSPRSSSLPPARSRG